jgi:hypothetical protein
MRNFTEKEFLLQSFTGFARALENKDAARVRWKLSSAVCRGLGIGLR